MAKKQQNKAQASLQLFNNQADAEVSRKVANGEISLSEWNSTYGAPLTF